MSKRRKSTPKIIEFQHEDASKLAELFNSFDKESLWPGGFTGGVPYTAERVLDSFPVGVRSICILISNHKGNFTGFCTVHPHYEDAEAAYIGVLGVHPDYLSQGHGKALLLKALQEATKNNLRRVDLNTWAGNLRAVPLYKKCGMFWVPETSVGMEDYIPGILRLPFAREFFKKHDWYSSQTRNLQLTPDKHKFGEMEVFPYEFSKGKDHLKVWVDRYGKGISGIEQTFDDKHLKITCRLGKHKVITGLEQELTIEVRNDTQHPIEGSMFLTGFEGLVFSTSTQQAFRVKNNTSITLNAKFTVNPEIEVPDITRKQKSIKANLIVNGELVPLEIGMRILPLLEFSTQPENIAVTPGTTGKIQLNAFNNSEEAFKGHIFLIDEDHRLSLGNNRIPMEISGKSHFGCTIGIKIDEDQPTSTIPFSIFARGKVHGIHVKTKTNTVYAKCLRPGGIVASVEDTKQGKAVIIETENLSAEVQLRGARLAITYKNARYGKRRIWSQGEIRVGPPFGFVRPIEYDYEIHQNPESLELTLSRMHQDKSGLKMTRMLTFYTGASLIKEQVRIVNVNPEATYEVNVRISGRASGERFNYTMIVPLEEIMEHEMIEFPVSESDLPKEPDKYGESWIAFQNHDEDFCFGRIWSKKKLSKIRIGDQSLFLPEYTLGEIKPGQSACTSELYYVLEKGDWQTIRKRWQSLIERALDPKDEIVRSQPLFNVKLAKSLLYDTTELITKLEVTNSRSKEVTGKITLKPPRGWKVNPSKISISKVTTKTPFSSNISIIPPLKADLGIHQGTINLSTDSQQIQFPMDLCLLSKTSKSKVRIVQDHEEGKTVFKISNDFLLFKASAEFAGCLYFLGKDEDNQLGTSFPNIGTKVFLENYSGGVRALYMGENFDFQKSKTHEESHKAKLIEEDPWKGIQFAYKSQQQEEIKGTLGSISYLTLPHSNIIKIKRRFENPTPASFSFSSFLWISPKVGGDLKKNEAVFPRRDRIYEFKRHDGFAVSGVQREKGWMLVRNRRRKLGLAVIAGNREKSTLLSLDLGNTMLELFVISKVQLQPGKSLELEDYVALTNADHRPMDRVATALRSQQNI